MGILNVFKSRHKEEVKTEVKMEAPEVKSWFEKEFSEKVDKANIWIQKTNKKILESLPEIKNSIQKLKEPRIEEKHREDSIINSLKDSYVKRSLSVYNKFPINDSENFNEKVQQVLNELNNPNGKEIYVVSTYFQKESKRLIDSIKQIQDLLNMMKNFLSNDGKVVYVRNQIEKLDKKYNEKVAENKNIEEEIPIKMKKIEELKEKTEKIESTIENLKNGDKAKTEIELKWVIELYEKEISELEALIRENLSCLKKPLEKFHHKSDKKNKLIDKFIKSPFKFFIESSDHVSVFLDQVKGNLESLNLKEKDIGKVKNIEFQGLAELKENYLNLIKQKSGKENLLHSLNLKREVEALEFNKEVVLKELNETKRRIEDKKSKISSNEEELSAVKSDFKKIIRELNIEIEL